MRKSILAIAVASVVTSGAAFATVNVSDTGISSDPEIYTKTETDNLLNDKANNSAVNNNTVAIGDADSGLTKGVADNKKSISDLESGQVATNTTNIEKNSEGVAVNAMTIQSEKLASQDADAALGARIDTNTTNIESNGDAIAINVGRLNDVEAETSNNTAGVQANYNDIGDRSEKTTSLTQDVDANAQSITDEAQARETSDQTLAQAIASESESRQDMDLIHTANIESNKSDIDTNTDAIDVEREQRIQEDKLLESRVGYAERKAWDNEDAIGDRTGKTTTLTQDVDKNTEVIETAQKTGHLPPETDGGKLVIETSGGEGEDGKAMTTVRGGTETTELQLTDDGANFRTDVNGEWANTQVSGIADGTSRYDAVNYGQLSAVQGYAQENRGMILNNQDKIKGLRADFEQMADEFDDYQSKTNGAIAGVAAMGQIAQPYGVGKANFGVGVANYDSEQAIAVGMGYRYSETVSYKGAVSANTGEDMEPVIAASVNWEF